MSEKDIIKDAVVESVINEFSERSRIGIEMYGTTLTDNNTDDFLQHALEEAMDFCLYIKKLQHQLKDQKPQ